MAKKNLSSLMSGIMGQPEPEETNIQSVSVAPDTAAKTPTEGKRRPGRPRNLNPELRATFIINPELLRKIKYINLVEGNLQKDVIDAALRQYISQWEAQNGTIRLPEKR